MTIFLSFPEHYVRVFFIKIEMHWHLCACIKRTKKYEWKVVFQINREKKYGQHACRHASMASSNYYEFQRMSWKLFLFCFQLTQVNVCRFFFFQLFCMLQKCREKFKLFGKFIFLFFVVSLIDLNIISTVHTHTHTQIKFFHPREFQLLWTRSICFKSKKWYLIVSKL